MTLSEAFESYRRDVVIFRNQSYKTEEQLVYALKSLLSYLGEDIPINELTFELIRDWKISVEKRISADTVRGYLNKLKVVLAYLKTVNVECLDSNRIILPKRENKPVDFLTADEVSRLIEVAGLRKRGYPEVNRLRNQAIISLLYASGIRISEMCRLDRDSIYKKTFTAYGKGNKSRVAFIDDRTEILLTMYLDRRTDSNPALILSSQVRKRITPGCVQKVMRDIGLKADFKKPIHPHIFRHSYATNLLFNNTNPRFVQALLGHSSLDTTMQYMNIVNEDLRAIYEAKHTC